MVDGVHSSITFWKTRMFSIRTIIYYLYRDAFRIIKMDINTEGIQLNSFLQTENIVEYRTIQYTDDVVLIMKD